MTATSRSTTLRAILFDMDGTLSETEELHRLAFNTTFADHDLDWYWDRDEYQRLLRVKGGQARIQHYIDTVQFDTTIPGVRSEFAGRLHRFKRDLMGRQLAAGAATIRPGIRRLVAEARARGVRLGVVTAATRPTVDALIRAMPGIELADFDAIVTSDRVAHNKPAPDLYLQAMADLNLSAHQCIAIEDCAMGVASARAAGLPVLVTLSEYGPDAPHVEAGAVVSHLGDPGDPCVIERGAPQPDGVIDVDYLARVGGGDVG